MTAYNLTATQKQMLRGIVGLVQAGTINEEFEIYWSGNEATGFNAMLVCVNKPGVMLPTATKSGIAALGTSGLLACGSDSSRQACALTGEGYTAVENDFHASDTSFVQYLNPLTDISGFDTELKTRCLPLLAGGGTDPMLWDSAVRTAGVILEERLRDVGDIADPSKTGQGLVNAVFNSSGTLAPKFSVDAERQGYRDLYAGIVGTVRNPSAHRLIDPLPEEGGALLVFVNLLLKKLEALR